MAPIKIAATLTPEALDLDCNVGETLFRAGVIVTHLYGPTDRDGFTNPLGAFNVFEVYSPRDVAQLRNVVTMAGGRMYEI